MCWRRGAATAKAGTAAACVEEACPVKSKSGKTAACCKGRYRDNKSGYNRTHVKEAGTATARAGTAC